MKKHILIFSILSSFALGASAAPLPLVGGGTTMDTKSIAGTYDQINITAGDKAFAGNSSTGTIIVEKNSDSGLDSFDPTTENSFINAASSYAFNSDVVLYYSKEDTEGNKHISVNISNGATLTFNQGITVKTINSTDNLRLRFGSDRAVSSGTATPKGNVVINAVTGSIVNSESKKQDAELILRATNLTIQNTNTATNTNPVYLGNYVHLYNTSELILSTNAQTGTLAVRDFYSTDPNKLAGTVKLNGNTLTVTGNVWVNESKSKGGHLAVDMTGDGSVFIASNIDTGTDTNFFLDFINFTSEDKILFKSELDDTHFAMLSINGLQGNDNIKWVKEGNYYSYYVTAVPEPSTYAVIFGAIALGFVAYRRRK